ncbi:MAG: tyrosine-type recombinase/integrase [Anaerolineae bacterium]
MRARWKGFESPLSDGIERFLTHKRALGRKFRTEEAALRLWDRFLVERGIGQVVEIGSEVVDAFLRSRPRTTPRSYNHLVGVLARLFSWLVGQGELASSPVKAPFRCRGAERIPFLFGRSEARQLLQQAANLQDWPRAPLRGLTYRTIFALLYGLGLRVGEASRLCCQDVDRQRDLLVIRFTKFAKSRLVPFGPRMALTLQEYLQARAARYGPESPQAPLFSFGGKRAVHPCTISQTFHALIPLLKLKVPPGVRPPCSHSLRHSFAVGTLLRWYRAGIDPSAHLLYLSTFLGHADPASTAVYLSITSELLDEANRRFERFAALAIEEVSP